jgi:hypothetical protein
VRSTGAAVETLPAGPSGTGLLSSRMVAIGPPKGAAATLQQSRSSLAFACQAATADSSHADQRCCAAWCLAQCVCSWLQGRRIGCAAWAACGHISHDNTHCCTRHAKMICLLLCTPLIT